MRHLVLGLVLACGLAVVQAGAAQAQLAETLDVGVSGLLLAGGSFLDEPDDKGVGGFEVAYPGFGGFGTGGGLALDVRWLGIVGLEIDVLFSEDRGSGEINDQDVKIGQDAVHVPILLKACAPLAVFRPNIFVGYEFVFVDKASAETIFTNIDAAAEDYELVTFGLGFELALPINAVDVRIPMSFRGSVNQDTPDTVEGRVVLTGNQLTYKSEWKFHTQVLLGVSYYFL